MSFEIFKTSLGSTVQRNLKKTPLAPLFRWIKRARSPYDEFVRFHAYFNLTQSAPDGLLLGDSVAERTSWHDTDKTTLAQMLKSALSDVYNLGTISYSAFNMKILSYFIEALQVMKRRPRFVILPINMRSFSPQWDLEPSWQFDTEIDLISKFISNPGMVPSYVPEVMDLGALYEEFDSTSVQYGLSELKSIGQFRLVISGKPSTAEQRNYRLAQLYIFHYAFALKQNHRKLTYLRKLLNLLQEMKIYGFLYVTQINIESGRKYASEGFEKSIRTNVAVVKDVVAEAAMSNAISFFDYGEALSPKYFFHEEETTEHLNQAGRRVVASLIAEQIKKLSL